MVIGYHYFGKPVGGQLGVDAFFVLSGFFITLILVEQQPSFTAFYARRARRILPALVVMLSVFMLVVSTRAAVTGDSSWLPRHTLGVLSGVTFWSNFKMAYTWPPFSGSLACAGLMTFGMYAMLFLTPLYLQTVRGTSAFMAAIELLPMSVTFFVVSQASGWVVDRFGARTVLRGSLLVLALGYGALPLVRVPWEAFVCMAIAGLGNGGFWPSQSALIMGLAPPDLRHQVSAVGRTVYNLGLGMGAALGGLIVTGATSSHFTVLFVFDALTFVAFAAVTLPVVTSLRSCTCSGLQPAGRQPSAGTFTVSAPIVITVK